MRKEKNVITLLRALSSLLAEEHANNPAFARKLDMLLEPRQQRRLSGTKLGVQDDEWLPDIYAEWNSRGEVEFHLWLCTLSIPILRKLIRLEDLDPTRRTTKWREGEKLAGYIADAIRARQSRGSAFIGKAGK